MVILGVPPMYRGNQVQILSSTRYCHLHYEKSKKPLRELGRQTFRREPGNLPCRKKDETKASGIRPSGVVSYYYYHEKTVIDDSLSVMYVRWCPDSKQKEPVERYDYIG